jgi:hypothetical protein
MKLLASFCRGAQHEVGCSGWFAKKRACRHDPTWCLITCDSYLHLTRFACSSDQNLLRLIIGSMYTIVCKSENLQAALTPSLIYCNCSVQHADHTIDAQDANHPNFSIRKKMHTSHYSGHSFPQVFLRNRPSNDLRSGELLRTLQQVASKGFIAVKCTTVCTNPFHAPLLPHARGC